MGMKRNHNKKKNVDESIEDTTENDNKEIEQVPEEEEEEQEVPKWYSEFKDDPPGTGDFDEDLLVNMTLEAQNSLDEQTKFYNSKKRSKDVNEKWLNTAMAKGTLGDKIAALVVSIQNSPVHNLATLTSLVNMVKVAKKKQCILAMEAVSELFIEDLLVPGRKLKKLSQQPLNKLTGLCEGCGFARRKRLATWMFEEKMKELYESFIKEIDLVAKDTVESNREKAIVTMNFLLASHPELEDFLLRNLINKMGDPSQKVASKVMYCLTQLLRAHPNMKQVVLNEIEKLIFRPNVSERTQYYCVCFISQFVYRNKEEQIARNVINIYFSFFKAAIKKGEVDTRLMAALLMGVKRAYPFAKFDKGENSVMAQNIDTLYKIVHISNFNISLHTLCLLQQATRATDDRFYSALYKKILDKKLANSTHHAMLINLIYKAMINDDNPSRIIAFIKRLFQICLHLPVPLVCGFLYMISQIVHKKKNVKAFETKAQKIFTKSIEVEDDDDDEEEKYFDIKEEEGEGSGEEKQPSNEIEGESVVGWYHCSLNDSNNKKNQSDSNSYDPHKRNPSFCKAEMSAYLELISLERHFHPTVSLFAQKILKSELITYTGDPLCDFTLVRFLERFVFKNPKKVSRSEREEKGPDPVLAVRKYYQPIGIKGMSITSSEYLKQEETTIPVDELFLYRYLKDKYGEAGPRVKKEDDEDDDADSVASDEFEEMIQGMIGGKKGNLNFMGDVGDNLSKGKSKLDELEESSDEGSEEEDEEIDDDLEMEDLSGSSEDEVLEFSDEDGEEPDLDIDKIMNEKDGGKKKKKDVKVLKKMKMKFSKKDGLAGLFAPAEEFSELLDEAGAGMKTGMASSMANKDNAALKQLNWESSRNRWVKGLGEFKRKRGSDNKQGKKKFKKR